MTPTIYKARRKGFISDENEWLEGVIIQEGEHYYLHSPGSLVKPITSHFVYALCVEVEKESITPIE